MTSYGARMSRWPQPRTEGRDSGLVALMEGESVSSITSRSIPMPSPPIHSIRRTETLPTDRLARGLTLEFARGRHAMLERGQEVLVDAARLR